MCPSTSSTRSAVSRPTPPPRSRPSALGESYHRSFGLPVTILRPFNTFGPRQSARAIIPAIISQALAVPVIKLGRLDPRRDLTYVKDTVEGFVAIASCDQALGRAVNIGRGDDISIGELVERIGKLMGRPIEVKTDSDRVRPTSSEVERLLAGTKLARSLWNWQPRYSLDQGLEETISWIREHRATLSSPRICDVKRTGDRPDYTRAFKSIRSSESGGIAV